MVNVSCPVAGCAYQTGDLDSIVVAQLLAMHNGSAHAQTTQTPPMKVENVKRPTITSGGSNEEWEYFITRWNDYVDATQIDGKKKVIQLLECCDEDLRRDITRLAGGSLVDKSEKDVLQSIKSLAVREENSMVARVQLHNMTQDHNEGMRSFSARIRGQANVCKYVMKCPGCDNNVSYMDNVLRDRVN